MNFFLHSCISLLTCLFPLFLFADAKTSPTADKPMDVDPESLEDDMMEEEEGESQDFLTKELVRQSFINLSLLIIRIPV